MHATPTASANRRMNPVTRFMAVALGAIAFLIFCALLEGPDETQAAQDSADDTTAAQQLASDTAACSAHYGPRAQTFLLDGVHLVCRPPQAAVTAQVQP